MVLRASWCSAVSGDSRHGCGVPSCTDVVCSIFPSLCESQSLYRDGPPMRSCVVFKTPVQVLR